MQYYNTKIFGLTDETERLNKKISNLENDIFEQNIRHNKVRSPS